MPVYVQHEVLGKVADVFNAEALWQAPGLALFARRPLLRDLLERSPREQRGRAATRCFSHITLMLPQDDVDDDRHLTRGARVRDLAASLAALHQKDFGDLLGNDEVRYDVVGAESLAAGQVEVRFGHAVYLPAAGEAVLYQVATSSDSAIWQTRCPIYQNQRLALVGAAATDAADAADAAGGSNGEPAILLINDGADAPLEVQVRPKQAFDCSFDPLGGYYVIRSKAGLTPARRLLLKVTRLGAPAPARAPIASAASAGAPARAATVWKQRGAETAAASSAEVPAASDATALPLAAAPATARGAGALDSADATYAPLAGQRVTLAALALPRLSRYRETGAAALEIGFDEQLAVAAPGVEAVIRFAVDGNDALMAITAAGREAISVPSSFSPMDGASIGLASVAAAMAERYCALLILPAQPRLSNPPGLPVPGGARFVFGRGAPMLAALRVLDSPRFVRSAAGLTDDSASADRIGLSRNAFSFEATAGGFQIGRLAATQALYHLDARLDFVATLDGAAPYLLPPGHHLVAGHYVLRFDA
ncbi:hypothetical protein [Massilia sp. PWRC2]|uniref:hypothetical protein n=1 Tax=Massilia sp. PWRC2 TaxID=2804626 RepID=UPI003CF4419C